MFITKLTRNYRKFYSTLYVPDNKAKDKFAYLTPYINLDGIFKNKTSFVENFKNRKISVEFEQIEEKWNFYRELKSKKDILEKNRASIADSLKKLYVQPEENATEIDKLKLHIKLVKEDLNNLKEFFYDVEESVMLDVLKFPNSLHENTPKDNPIILYECQKDNNNSKTESHMEIGGKLNLIKYINSSCCYLKNDAALFEISILNYFRVNLLKLQFTQFSNTCFVKSIVAEGCGLAFEDNNKLFKLNPHHQNESSEMHLVGNASLSSFMAYFTKYLLPTSRLPLKTFSIGRIYQPSTNSSPNNLFNLCQQSGLSVFIATNNNQNQILDDLISNLTNLYKDLGYQFRLSIQPAHKLHLSESYRLSVEMFSNNLQCFMEIGHVSCYDDYLSKRLLFNHVDNDKKRYFPKVIAGCIVNIHKILACIIENNGELVNSRLRNYLDC